MPAPDEPVEPVLASKDESRRRRFSRDLDWEHHPENDHVVEHYSCPFGLVVRSPDERWEAWLLSPAVREVYSPEEIGLERFVGIHGQPQHAKQAVLRHVTVRYAARRRSHNRDRSIANIPSSVTLRPP